MEGAIEVGRQRRGHSAEFKAQVMQACSQPGVSVASVALAHGLNANLVRRWSKGPDTGCGVALEAARPVQRDNGGTSAAFVPVRLEMADSTARDIRLELHRRAATVIVSWPSQEAAARGAWLREWLR